MDVKDAKVAQWVKDGLLAGKFGNYTAAARSAGNQKGWNDEQKEEGRTLASHYFSSKETVKKRKAPAKKAKTSTKPTTTQQSAPAAAPAVQAATVTTLPDLSTALAEGFKGISESINKTFAMQHLALNELTVKLDQLITQQDAARAKQEAMNFAEELARFEARRSGPLLGIGGRISGRLSEGSMRRGLEADNFAQATLVTAPSSAEQASTIHQVVETMQLLQSLGLSAPAREKVQTTFAEMAPLLASALLAQVKRHAPPSDAFMREMLGAAKRE